jgi:ketosteroid isomerase-like protein
MKTLTNIFIAQKLSLSLVIFLTFSSISFAQNKNVTAIKTMLAAQVTEWNKGNIDGYMQGYWEDDSLLFIGSKGPRYGYDVTLKRYKEAYPDTAHMGKLTSTITRIQKLSGKYYFVVGKWALQRSVGDVSGSYTLLLKKVKRKWVIIADHSS